MVGTFSVIVVEEGSFNSRSRLSQIQDYEVRYFVHKLIRFFACEDVWSVQDSRVCQLLAYCYQDEGCEIEISNINLILPCSVALTFLRWIC